MSMQVALEALAQDAATWQDTSASLGGAASAVAGLTLTAAQLSWASQDSGLEATYEEIRLRVHQLLEQGSAETQAIGTTLLEVKQTYESTDSAASGQLEGLWEPTP